MHGQHIIISQTNIYIFSTFVRRLTLLFLTQMMYIPGLDIGFSSVTHECLSMLSTNTKDIRYVSFPGS